MLRVRRYWIEFDATPDAMGPLGGSRGFGVTGYDEEDALRLLREQIFEGAPLPAIRTIIEDIDVSTLDEGHVLPNIGVPVWRGVWFPRRNV